MLLKEKKYDKIPSLFKKAETYCRTLQNNDILEMFYELKIKYLEQQNNYKEAYYLLKKLKDIVQNDYKERINDKIDELTLKFDTIQKEKEIEYKNKEISILLMQNKLKNLKIVKQRIVYHFIILIIFVFAVFIAIGLYFKYKKNIQLQKEINQRKEAEKKLLESQERLKIELENKVSRCIELNKKFLDDKKEIELSKRTIDILSEAKEKLLHEVYHRVYNNLQIILGIIKIHAMNADSETSKVLKDLSQRIKLIATIEANYHKEKNIDSVNLPDIINIVFQQFYYNYKDKVKKIKFQLDVTDYAVKNKFIIPFTFIVYELLEYIGLNLITSNNVDKITIFFNKKILQIEVEGEEIEKKTLEKKNVSLELVEIFIKQINAQFEITQVVGKRIFKIILRR